MELFLITGIIPKLDILKILKYHSGVKNRKISC